MAGLWNASYLWKRHTFPTFPCGKCSCVLHQRQNDFSLLILKINCNYSQNKCPSSVCNSLDSRLRESPCIWQIPAQGGSFWDGDVHFAKVHLLVCGGLSVNYESSTAGHRARLVQDSLSPVCGTQRKDRKGAAVTCSYVCAVYQMVKQHDHEPLNI